VSDSTICPSCDASVPAGATFCTSCGAKVGGASAAASPAPSEHGAGSDADATRVDAPGLHDATEVFHPPAAPGAPPPPAAPWQPSESAPPSPSGTAPWDPPAPPSPPPWQQPPPQAGGQGGWGQPAPQAPPTSEQWGAPAPEPAPSSSSAKAPSPLGGLVAAVGSVLVLVGLFLPWIGNNRDDGRYEASGWDLTSGDQALESTDPYLVLALGVVGLVVAALLFTGLARIIVRIAAVIAGVAVVAILARDWMTITDLVADDQGVDSTFEVAAQLGFYLTIAGAVVLALAALAPATKRSSSPRT
jgi:hypothetical protein